MATPYVGEIRIFAGNFAPVGWAFCDGQLMAISQNETLFNLIGTTYGGDGQSTFGLPDLRGRIPIHMGNGFTLAENGGVETVTLTTNQVPVHTHPLLASVQPAGQSNPQGNVLGQSASADLFITDVTATTLNPSAVGTTGGSQPHTNLQPYLCVSFIISLFGIFPSQT
jgi:microcystin-dependent protein